MERTKKITSTTKFLAVILSTVVAVTMPTVYFLLGYQDLAAVIQTEAESNALLVSQIINASPGYWRYEQLRFEAVLSGFYILQRGEACRILDTAGTVIAQNAVRIDGLTIARSHNLYDSGNVVGRIEIRRSLHPLVINTLAVSFLSIMAGLSLYTAFKVFPLSALSGALQSLYEEKEMVREKEERLRTITDTAQDAIVMMDNEGNISFWNAAAERIFGYSSEEALGKELHTLLGPQSYHEAYRKGFEIFRKTGQGAAVGKTLELGAIRKGGLEFPMELSLSAIQIRDKWHAVGIMRDITERTRIEAELELRNIILSTQQEVAIDGILIVDENSRIVSFNGRFIDMWGIPPGLTDTGYDEPVSQFVVGRTAEPESFIERVNYLYEHREMTGRDEIELRDGRTFDRYTAPMFGKDRRYYGRVWYFRDITEQKRVEKEIRKLNENLDLKVQERTQQLVEAQEELVRREKLSILGQLAGSVGHELRNPLGVISNAVYFLKTVMPDADETVREYLGIIKNEVNASERIISDLLDFSRTKTPQTKALTAGELIHESISKCALPENVTVGVDIPDTLPMIKVDPFQMAQVFQNLITNAIQAMREGGKLLISAREADGSQLMARGKNDIGSGLPPKSYEREGDFIEISFTDTGEGISPENMKKLFQPLFTTKAKGIGLGLVVSKRLTEANGGWIEVQSEPGEGTTFTVALQTATRVDVA